MTGDLNLTTEYQLKHLDLSDCDLNDGNNKQLLLSCNSLQKLVLPRLNDCRSGYDFTLDLIKNVCLKNGKTLQVLDINLQTWYSRLKGEAVHTIVKHCTELKEFNAEIMLNKNAGLEIDYLAKNLTPKVEKLSLQYARCLEDEHLRVLLSRCNQLKELIVASTSITNASLPIIIQKLKHTLEKLDVSDTNISFDQISEFSPEFRAMPKLKFLNCSYRGCDDLKNLGKKLPKIGINQGDFHIAKTWISFTCGPYDQIKKIDGKTPGQQKGHNYEYINKHGDVWYLKYLW